MGWLARALKCPSCGTLHDFWCEELIAEPAVRYLFICPDTKKAATLILHSPTEHDVKRSANAVVVLQAR